VREWTKARRDFSPSLMFDDAVTILRDPAWWEVVQFAFGQVTLLVADCCLPLVYLLGVYVFDVRCGMCSIFG
jgi:hypothetical protein